MLLIKEAILAALGGMDWSWEAGQSGGCNSDTGKKGRVE